VRNPPPGEEHDGAAATVPVAAPDLRAPVPRPEGELLRHAMSQLSSGVAIVSTVWEGRLHAMTATAVCSVSLDPPLILVCVSRTSRFSAAILGSGRWAVSLLAGDQEAVARHFADRGRDLLTQFDDVPHVLGSRTDAPLVEGMLAWLECETFSVHDGGDHSIVVGRVLDAGTDASTRPALTYLRGRYS
jgi:flavin reductase (DIM6/NTAB) family NADH-FMN oxidoreductase RutF